MVRSVKKLEYRFCKLCNIVVSMKANRIKTDATVEEIRKVADFYEKLLKNSHNKN